MYKNNLDWKEYEAITKYIYETLGKESGVTILGYGNSCKVKGKSGVYHQIDVLTSHSDGIHGYRTAIECKYLKKKVTKDTIMKVLNIIQDAQIEKGIIVSKSGFTKDAFDFAQMYNIGLVELREVEDKDFRDNPKEIHFGDLILNSKIIITRPQILNIDIGNNKSIEIKEEWDYYKYFIRLENHTKIPLIEYVNKFRKEIKRINKKTEKVIKQYKIPNATIFNKETTTSIKIDQITFTGRLIDIDASQSMNFRLVDKVWLIMKSIFEERTFTFSENGLIVERKRK
ncbi:restriction endonuclease [uncultured Kordia sp.]|uniref:restriction endonuclease n=1 Tax=uncultured Kordia sp. TaxID=507699 RepID=UPI002613B7E0|nr:restriction endonuclease [uncultured Kordia sp.]